MSAEQAFEEQQAVIPKCQDDAEPTVTLKLSDYQALLTAVREAQSLAEQLKRLVMPVSGGRNPGYLVDRASLQWLVTKPKQPRKSRW